MFILHMSMNERRIVSGFDTRSHRGNTIVTPTHVASSVDGNGGKYSFFNSHDQKIIKYEIYFKAF